MDATSVTSKGQVTIPESVRRRFGIRQGSRVAFRVVDDHMELRIVTKPVDVPAGGFGLLKTRKPSVAADFDPASVLSSRARRR